MDQSSGTENVIYVQVDEEGRVVNYSSNMSGGEQVILLQDGGNGEQIVVNQPAATTQPPVVKSPPPQQQQTMLSPQTTLVDQSGVPVMVLGQPSEAATVSQSVVSSGSGVGNTVISSSGVVDQSGVPVMVLGEASSASQIPSSSIVQSQQPQQSAAIIQQQTTPLMTKPISPGRSIIISSNQSPGSTMTSPPKTVITAQNAARAVAAGTNLMSPKKITSQTPSLVIKKGPGGSIVIPKPGNKPGIIVSRSITQVPGGSVLVSRQKPGISSSSVPGIVRLTRPLPKPIATSSISHVTVTQPVLTFFTEPKETMAEMSKNQAAEVSSTVNGMEESVENTSSDPIEIPDDDEDIRGGENTGAVHSMADKIQHQQSHPQEVIKDVEISPVKDQDNKSEDDEIMDTDTAKDNASESCKDSSGNKAEPDLDSDLMMYLGGGSVSETPEDKVENKETEKSEQKQQPEQEFMETDETEKKEDQESEQNDEEVSSHSDEELPSVQKLAEESAEVKEDEIQEKNDELESVEENEIINGDVKEQSSDEDAVNGSAGDEYDDEDDDDEEFPAGLIRGEPIHVQKTEKDDAINDTKDNKRDEGNTEKQLEHNQEVVESSSVNDKADQHREQVKKNSNKEYTNIEDKIEFTTEETSEPNEQPTETEVTSKDSTVEHEGKPVERPRRGRPKKDSIETAKPSNNKAVEDPYMFGFEELSTEVVKKKKNKTSKTDRKPASDDLNKESFMANFNLLSPKGIQKLNRRSSKRVLHAEAEKQRDSENGDETKSAVTKSTLKLKTKTKLPESEGSAKNIFEMFDSVDSDIPSLQSKVRKLQTLNNELRNKLRETEHKLVSNQASNARYHEVKSMEHKIEKLEKLNSELTTRLQGYEGKPTPQERTVDVSFKMGTLSFKTPATGGSPSVMGSSPSKKSHKDEGLHEKRLDLKTREEAIEKKERKLRCLDQELDLRASTYKSKESKLQRLITEIKTREQKLEYQESAIERRVKDIEYRERMLEGKTKAALEKMHKSGGRGLVSKGTADEDAVRSSEMKRFEQEQKDRELKEREALLKSRELALIDREKVMQSNTPVQPNPGRGRPKMTPTSKTPDKLGSKSKVVQDDQSSTSSNQTSHSQTRNNPRSKPDKAGRTPKRENQNEAVTTTKSPRRPITKTHLSNKKTPSSRGSTPQSRVSTTTDSPKQRGRPSLSKQESVTSSTNTSSSSSRSSTPHSGRVKKDINSDKRKRLSKGPDTPKRGRPSKGPETPKSGRPSKGPETPKSGRPSKDQDTPKRGRPSKGQDTPKSKKTPVSEKKAKSKAVKTSAKPTGRKSLGATPKSSSAKKIVTTRKRTRSLSPNVTGGRGMRIKKPKVK